MDDLDRLYRLLVRNARTAGADYLARPFELAELYQTLIPYRHYRRELGIETSEDYELALMRLIAGERGYLAAEPEVQQALMRELGSPNPEPSAFRQFAHSHVAFQPDAVRTLTQGDGVPVQRTSTAPSAAPSAAPSFSAAMQAPASPPASAAPSFAAARPTPSAPPSPPSPSMSAPRPSSAMPAPPPLDTPVAGRAPLTIEAHGACRYCGGTLPDGRRITFCPHCGQNLTLQHCPACGTELELGWKFCVVCGRAT